MHAGKFIFAQLMEYIPWRRFQTLVNRYDGDHKTKTYPCAEQLRMLMFGQLTYRHSLREIETCLRAVPDKLYHLGIRSTVSFSNLAHANNTRDWRIYAELAQLLIHQAKQLYCHDGHGLDLDATVYALDSTVIDLCYSLFPWAPFRRTKSAIKLYALLDLQGNIPDFILISSGKMHDVNVLDVLPIVAGAYYVMDRGYLDFARLFAIHQAQAFFVTRANKNMAFRQRYSALLDDLTASGLLDETLVVVMGEFGRSLKINKAGGRDHWGNVFSLALAGAGITGQVIGASDRIGAVPADHRPVRPPDLAATIFHLLGIDPPTRIHGSTPTSTFGHRQRHTAQGNRVKIFKACWTRPKARGYNSEDAESGLVVGSTHPGNVGLGIMRTLGARPGFHKHGA